MATSYTDEHVNSIVEQFVSGKWRFNREWEKLPIHVLNSAIVEAQHRLRYEMRLLNEQEAQDLLKNPTRVLGNENDQRLFDHLVVFIKANIPYSADEIFMDMYNSGRWFPHTSLTSMTTPQLNEFLLYKLVELQDKKQSYDINELNSLGLYLKSFIKFVPHNA